MGTTATLLAGIDRALDPNGDGDLADHANVILAPLAEPFCRPSARRPRRSLRKASNGPVPCSWQRPATTARPGRASARSHRPPPRPAGWRWARAMAVPRFRRSMWRSARTASRRASTTCRCSARSRPRATRRFRSCSRPALRSPIAHAPADVVAGTDEGDFIVDGTSLVSGKAVLLPRDGASIAQRAAAAGAAGASALVLYGDGGAPAGALGLDDRVKLPIAVLPGDQGAAAAATLLTGGAVTITFTTTAQRRQPSGRLRRGLLVHRPGVRRLDQARPRRAGRGGHDLRAGRPVPRPERHVRGRRAGRGRRGARTSGASDLGSADRARCARRDGDGRRRRGGRPRGRRGAGRRRGQSRAAPWRPRWSPSRRR